jgi:hypothetical protein
MSHQSLASNNTFLNDQCINEEIREEIFKILELKIKSQHTKIYWIQLMEA